jgi:hypothetical protein
VASTIGAPEQIIVGVVIALVALSIPVIIQLISRMHRDLHDIKGVLITPKPTGLVPNPPKGLVDVVAGLAHTAVANLSGTGALVSEKAGNGDSGMDVAKDTIETEQRRIANEPDTR